MTILKQSVISLTSAQVFPGFLFSPQIRQPRDGEPRYRSCRGSGRQTVRRRPREKARERRPSVCKSLGLSVVSTTKADSHFVLICWPIMMRNEQGDRREGRGDERECWTSAFRSLGSGLDRHKHPFCQTETPAVLQMGSVIWSHLVYNVRPQNSPSLFDAIIWKSRKRSTPLLLAAVEVPSFSVCVCNSSRGIILE